MGTLKQKLDYTKTAVNKIDAALKIKSPEYTEYCERAENIETYDVNERKSYDNFNIDDSLSDKEFIDSTEWAVSDGIINIEVEEDLPPLERIEINHLKENTVDENEENHFLIDIQEEKDFEYEGNSYDYPDYIVSKKTKTFYQGALSNEYGMGYVSPIKNYPCIEIEPRIELLLDNTETQSISLQSAFGSYFSGSGLDKAFKGIPGLWTGQYLPSTQVGGTLEWNFTYYITNVSQFDFNQTTTSGGYTYTLQELRIINPPAYNYYSDSIIYSYNFTYTNTPGSVNFRSSPIYSCPNNKISSFLVPPYADELKLYQPQIKIKDVSIKRTIPIPSPNFTAIYHFQTASNNVGTLRVQGLITPEAYLDLCDKLNGGGSTLPNIKKMNEMKAFMSDLNNFNPRLSGKTIVRKYLGTYEKPEDKIIYVPPSSNDIQLRKEITIERKKRLKAIPHYIENIGVQSTIDANDIRQDTKFYNKDTGGNDTGLGISLDVNDLSISKVHNQCFFSNFYTRDYKNNDYALLTYDNDEKISKKVTFTAPGYLKTDNPLKLTLYCNETGGLSAETNIDPTHIFNIETTELAKLVDNTRQINIIKLLWLEHNVALIAYNGVTSMGTLGPGLSITYLRTLTIDYDGDLSISNALTLCPATNPQGDMTTTTAWSEGAGYIFPTKFGETKNHLGIAYIHRTWKSGSVSIARIMYYHLARTTTTAANSIAFSSSFTTSVAGNRFILHTTDAEGFYYTLKGTSSTAATTTKGYFRINGSARNLKVALGDGGTARRSYGVRTLGVLNDGNYVTAYNPGRDLAGIGNPISEIYIEHFNQLNSKSYFDYDNNFDANGGKPLATLEIPAKYRNNGDLNDLHLLRNNILIAKNGIFQITRKNGEYQLIQLGELNNNTTGNGASNVPDSYSLYLSDPFKQIYADM